MKCPAHGPAEVGQGNRRAARGGKGESKRRKCAANGVPTRRRTGSSARQRSGERTWVQKRAPPAAQRRVSGLPGQNGSEFRRLLSDFERFSRRFGAFFMDFGQILRGRAQHAREALHARARSENDPHHGVAEDTEDARARASSTRARRKRGRR